MPHQQQHASAVAPGTSAAHLGAAVATKVTTMRAASNWSCVDTVVVLHRYLPAGWMTAVAHEGCPTTLTVSRRTLPCKQQTAQSGGLSTKQATRSERCGLVYAVPQSGMLVLPSCHPAPPRSLVRTRLTISSGHIRISAATRGRVRQVWRQQQQQQQVGR